MLISTLVVGFILGGTYALIALGLTLQYGVARVVNLAYGEIVVAGAFLVFMVVTGISASPLIGLAVAMPLGFVASYALYALVLEPLVRRAKHLGRLEIDTILVTFGFMFLAQGIFVLVFGVGFTGYAWLQAPVDILGAEIAVGRVLGLVLACLLGGGLWLVTARTRWGVSLRAVATHPELTPLVGIDRHRFARVAFAIGGAIAAAGGAILSMNQPFTATDGGTLTMKALVIVTMGGVGNVGGALAAGLLVGVVEAFVSYAVDPGLTLAATYAIFLAALIWRPTGLFA